MFETWLVLFLILVFIELATINLVSIWFAVGAFCSMLVSIFVSEIWIQVLIFAVISVISFILMKPILKRLIKTNPEKTNLDRVVGQVGVVTKDIGKRNPGEVKVDGKFWMAVSDHAIKEGKEVEILSIDGVKLYCKEIQ